MKSKSFTKPALLMLLLAFTVTSTGCFKMGRLSLYGNGANDSAGGGGGDVVVVPPGVTSKTVAVLEASQVLPTLQAVTGVTAPSTLTKNTFASNKQNFSVDGDAAGLNAPMVLAFTAVASEFCNDLVVKEKALAAGSRRFFGSIDFTQGPAQFTGTALNTTIQIMARSFWGYDASANDITAITTNLQTVIANPTSGSSAATQTSQAATALCTGMLSSMSTLRH